MARIIVNKPNHLSIRFDEVEDPDTAEVYGPVIVTFFQPRICKDTIWLTMRRLHDDATSDDIHAALSQCHVRKLRDTLTEWLGE